MPRTPDSSEVIIVTIGDREFKTALYNGVQRFMPHNETPTHLAEKMKDWDAWVAAKPAPGFRVPSDMYDPNQMSIDYYNGMYTTDEVLSYETNSGYSVCGLADLSFFDELEIVNPLWKKE